MQDYSEARPNLTGPGSQGLQPVTGDGSLRKVSVHPGSKVYCYLVSVDHDPVLPDIPDPAMRARTWQANRHLVNSVNSATRRFWRGQNAPMRFAYDGHHKLYTNMPIKDLLKDPADGKFKAVIPLRAGAPNEDMDAKPLIRQYDAIEPDPEVPDFVRKYYRSSEVTVTITYDGETEATAADGFSPVAQFDAKKIEAFLFTLMADIATNSMRTVACYPMDSDKIFMVQKEDRRVADAFVLHKGLFLEPRVTTTRDGLSTLLATDLVVAPFYIGQPLEQAMQACRTTKCDFDHNLFTKQFKDVRCYLRHDRTLSVVIEGLTDHPIKDLRQTDDDDEQTTITMKDVFQDKYGEVDVDRPAVRVSGYFPDDSDADDAYPMEALIIMSFQRVPLTCVSKTLAEGVIEENERVYLDEVLLERALFVDSAVRNLGMFGVSVATEWSNFTINPLGPMSVTYAGNTRIPVATADWTNAAANLQYFLPSPSMQLAIVYDSRLCPKNVNDLKKFANPFVNAALGKGLQFHGRQFICVDGIEGLTAHGEGTTFEKTSVVVYVDRKDHNSHGELKFWERTFAIPTLHITIDVIPNIQPKKLAELVAKLNMKTGGLCFKPRLGALLDSPVFVMGLAFPETQPDTTWQRKALNRAPSAVAVRDHSDLPFVIGVCANLSATNVFSGDYDYQMEFNDGIIEPRRLSDVSHWAFDSFLKHARECPPAVVFRYCSSEKSFASVRERELPRIIRGFASANGGQEPRIAYILATNQHAKQFVSANSVGHGGGVPGLVVGPLDCGDGQWEFYLEPFQEPPSKAPIKFTQCRVAYNTTNFRVDQLRDIAYELCYSRQTTAQPTALPEPIHRAFQLTTRGKSNIKVLRNQRRYNANNLDQARRDLCYRYATNAELVNKCFTA